MLNRRKNQVSSVDAPDTRIKPVATVWRNLLAGGTLLVFVGCGGGGGGANGGAGGGTTSTTVNTPIQDPVYAAGTYGTSSTYAGHCAAPRTGTNPQTGKAYVDVQGSSTWENFWLRSWTHELYLWYREVPDLAPASYSTVNYFPLQKTSALTASGHAKDKFHFTYSTPDWIALSQSGVSAGYGAEFAVIQSTPPRTVVVAYTEPGSPAANSGISRGDTVITVDGVDVINNNTSAGIDTLNAGLFPTALNQSHTFVLQALSGSQRTVTMLSTSVTSQPVQNVRTVVGTNGAVGYMLFNDHIATAEQELIDAFTTLKNSGVSDLVLDIRYNGGGYLDMASEVAYMIAGGAQTSGKTFELSAFNDQYPTTLNPVTGGTNSATPFHATAQGFSATSGAPLPTLGLSRVFVLTGPGTCSASESVMNSLIGVNVQVIQVGSTTCGKPYGFYPQDNCGTTYFSIELKGVNNAGFGDYSDGFSPANSLASNMGASLPGCSVADDFTHQLGDPSEKRLAAALYYRAALINQSAQLCVAGPTGLAPDRVRIQSATNGAMDLSAVDGELFKGAWRENRIMSR